MPSSTSSSEPFLRPVPALAWRGPLLTVLCLSALAIAAWELRCRAAGYAAGPDDTVDLWAEQRRQVDVDGIILVGSSRGLFGLDLDVLEEGLGRRPRQLALVGSNPLPILADLAADPTFRGTVVCDVVPGLLLAPAASPPYQNAVRALRPRSWAQRASHLLSLPLEDSFAFLQQEDLTLGALLKSIPLPERDGVQLPPPLPPYFYRTDRDRRARMIAAVESDQRLRERVRQGWIPLFTPPPLPKWVDRDGAMRALAAGFDARFADLARAVAAIRARGGRVLFVAMPVTGPLLEFEQAVTPRAAVWDRLLAATGAPGIHFQDHAELAGFACPDWSHLSERDSVEFTARLVPHLRRSLAHDRSHLGRAATPHGVHRP